MYGSIIFLRPIPSSCMFPLQNEEDLHISEIDKAYTAADEFLKKWRRNVSNPVIKRHREWRVMCEGGLGSLEKYLQQADQLSGLLHNLSLTDGLQFLQVNFADI